MKSYLLIAVAAVVLVLVVLFLLLTGKSSGDSGPGKALGLLRTESASAAGPPQTPPPPPPGLVPTYPGSSEDGGTTEGVAEDAPPPDEPPVEEDEAPEVGDDGVDIPVKEATPEQRSAPEPRPEPQVNRAGYCDPSGKFYDLAADQQLSDPEWAARGPWREADRDNTGAISCKPKAPAPTTPIERVQVSGLVELDIKQADGSTKCGRYVKLRFYPDSGGQSIIGYRTTCTTTTLTLAKEGSVCPVVRAERGLAPLTPACVHASQGEQMVALR